VLLKIVAAGTRMPAWVDAGFDDFASRLRGDYRLELVEVPLVRRSATPPRAAVREEGARMLAAAGRKAEIVALQVEGRALTTADLAQWLERRALTTSELAFCIGGPDGLDPALDERAVLKWSLSKLTLPHALVRVIVAEALYRAVTVIRRHPYHRA
jgi:23S rRNA (pseudouridine1915-N3)-methyltransferase